MDLAPRMYFSYSQFMVFDESVVAPGCYWTETHSAQGFARREAVVCFRTLLEFGYADVTFELRPYVPHELHERVTSVPLDIPTGKVYVGGPGEIGVELRLTVPKGHYRLVAAQRATSDEEEVIDLFFEVLDEPLRHSKVIVADKELDVPDELLETAELP